MTQILNIKHKAGFFSCCSVKLKSIINYYSKFNKPPVIDYTGLFSRYGTGNINDKFFLTKENINIYQNDIFHFNNNTQYEIYQKINLNKSKVWIEKYFSPSPDVTNNIDALLKKYPIFNNSTSNICSVFYRGNDKVKETQIASYDEFIGKAQEILNTNPNIIFHIQTDDSSFKDAFFSTFSRNSFYCEELPMINNKSTTTTDLTPKDKRINLGINFLSIVYILSKSNYLITHSGNCGLWAVLFRGNCINVHQYLRDKWYDDYDSFASVFN